MACCDVCPTQALSSAIDKNGFRYPIRDFDKCNDCGLCQKICTVLTQYRFQSTGKSTIYAAWHHDPVVRKKSSSGGVFAALAQEIIRQGGHVYGAALDGLNVHWKKIEHEKDIVFLQGSKYEHSDYSDSYSAVKKDLSAGIPVLFSGLSCQVAALQLFLGKDAQNPLLYTVDLVCTGVSSLLPVKFIERAGKGRVSIVSFRNKDHGWTSSYKLKVEGLDGYSNDVLSSFYYRMYGICKRNNCGRCSFAYHNRLSDITLADFWGDRNHPEEHANGVSAVIVHSSRGETLLNNADCELHQQDFPDFLQHNHRATDAEFAANHISCFWKRMGFLYLRLGYLLHFSIRMTGIVSAIEWLPLRIMNRLHHRPDTVQERERRNDFIFASKDW